MVPLHFAHRPRAIAPVLLALAGCAGGEPGRDGGLDAHRSDVTATDDTLPRTDGTDAPARDAGPPLLCGPASGGPRTGAMGSSALWPAARATDSDASTVWSSDTHATAQVVESLTVHYAAPTRVNFVSMVPRMDAGRALGFPVEFTIETSADGTTWTAARGFTHYPRPTTACVVLGLNDAVMASALRVTARVLGDDGVGNYVFQLAELDAGYDPTREPVSYAPVRAAASSELWPASAVVDGNASSVWSTVTHPTADASEWLAFWWTGLQPVDFVTFTPRFDDAGRAQGFPVAFDVMYSDGSHWNLAQHYAGFPTPHDGAPVILALGRTVMADGIQIVASTLGTDALGNRVMQMAETGAGHDARFDLFEYSGNNGTAGRMEVADVGSESFDRPEQLSHWDYDLRGVVIAPQPGGFQNIYAPSIVHTTGAGWNVYFGGWDGSPSQNDRLYRTSSSDDFLTFGAHALVVDHGAFAHANNDCTLRVADGDWRMVYTTDAALNKPAWSHSTDGLTWTPGVADASTLFSMTGYPNWDRADVNGSNVVIEDDAHTWHLFFDDFAGAAGAHHATSTDFVHWTYRDRPVGSLIMNDMKSFAYGGARYYLGLYHVNSQHVWMTVSSSLASIPAPTVLFDHANDADNYIVAVGMVQDGSRILGALYGAGAVPSLDHNRIFARWLQKRVIFQNAHVRWGDVEQARGPDRVDVFTAAGDDIETGRFDVYDSDGTTLLYRSPPVTMRVGDVFTYHAGY